MWTPTIEIESYHGIGQELLQTKLYNNRNIFITGMIDSENANSIVMQLMHLSETSDEEINIYINSPGGEVISGLLIYDVVQSLKVSVNMYCIGMAASMATIIFAGGQKGRRYILPHSKCMIHEPLINGGVGGSASSIKSISDSILETKKVVNEILSLHTGRTTDEIDELVNHDHYFNADEAVEFGIADKKVEGLKDK